MIQKKNAALYVALIVPVLMIVFVAVLISLQGKLVKPSDNFLYVTGTDYYYNGYTVSAGKLVQNQYNPDYYPKGMPYSEPIIYVYDVKNDLSTEISFADASKLVLDPSQKSADGYEVTSGTYDGGLFGAFFGGRSYDYNSHYIAGHGGSKKLNLKLVGPGYQNFQFMGWIK